MFVHWFFIALWLIVLVPVCLAVLGLVLCLLSGEATLPWPYVGGFGGRLVYCMGLGLAGSILLIGLIAAWKFTFWLLFAVLKLPDGVATICSTILGFLLMLFLVTFGVDWLDQIRNRMRRTGSGGNRK